ncbi:MAG: septum formation initiator family protein [Candidatus Dormibacterales bacterium]
MISAATTSRPHWVSARRAAYAVVICFALVWGGGAFAQEAYLSHKLNQQVAQLRTQNQVLAEQNQAYGKDVQGISSGSAGEEEARLNGYSRPNEHVYLVTVTPSPSPSPSPTSSPSPSPKPSRTPSALPSASPRSH